MKDFTLLSELIYRHSGICLAPSRRLMLANRLRRRIALGEYASLKDYIGQLFEKPNGQAIAALVELAVTHHTGFFREESHFEFLRTAAIPALTASAKGRLRPIRIWSAATSSGEEAYSLAMVLDDWFSGQGGKAWRILASDISRSILAEAERGIYSDRKMQGVGALLKSKYFEQGGMVPPGSYRVSPALRGAIDFQKKNLLDADYSLTATQDVIFCRNVMIYFDIPTRAAVVEHLARCLSPSGYLVIGRTENLVGISANLVRVDHGVFQRADTRRQGGTCA